ncbi:MAG TPA: hypothetical protein VMM79_10315 [Longimicrobiales bacterium]|nr:hypothetical protein [Longimicrobiales bacterium]
MPEQTDRLVNYADHPRPVKERAPAAELAVVSPRAVIEECEHALQLLEALVDRLGDDWPADFVAHIADVARRHAESATSTFNRVWAAHGGLGKATSGELGEDLTTIAEKYGRAVALLLADPADAASEAVYAIMEVWRRDFDARCTKLAGKDGAA